MKKKQLEAWCVSLANQLAVVQRRIGALEQREVAQRGSESVLEAPVEVAQVVPHPGEGLASQHVPGALYSSLDAQRAGDAFAATLHGPGGLYANQQGHRIAMRYAGSSGAMDREDRLRLQAAFRAPKEERERLVPLYDGLGGVHMSRWKSDC